MDAYTAEEMEAAYGEYVCRHYLGGTGEPISRENFLEDWDEMTDEERRGYVKVSR